MITFFVEGKFDDLFIRSLFPNLDLNIITYSEMKTEKINNWIKTLECMNEKYIFLFDTDFKTPEEKLNQKLSKFTRLNKTNCFAVVIEIESWIMAGCNNDILRKYKIKHLTNTNSYSKEKMQSDFHTNQLINIYQEILNSFSVEAAITRNDSFFVFYQKIKSFVEFK